MGTLVYVILKLAGVIETPDDLVHICQLISLDSIAAVLLLQVWLSRRKG